MRRLALTTLLALLAMFPVAEALSSVSTALADPRPAVLVVTLGAVLKATISLLLALIVLELTGDPPRRIGPMPPRNAAWRWLFSRRRAVAGFSADPGRRPG